MDKFCKAIGLKLKFLEEQQFFFTRQVILRKSCEKSSYFCADQNINKFAATVRQQQIGSPRKQEKNYGLDVTFNSPS